MAPLSSPPPYRKGQEVLRCEPFAYVVNTEYLNAVCDYCLRNTIKEENEGIKNTSDLDKCPKCEVVYYCNSICQKKAWDAYHLQECAYIRKLHPKYYKGYWFKNKNFAWWQCNAIVPPSGILDIIRFMARIILKLNLHGGDKDFVELPDGRKRYFQVNVKYYIVVAQSVLIQPFFDRIESNPIRKKNPKIFLTVDPSLYSYF